jgi:hypothetical protein
MKSRKLLLISVVIFGLLLGGVAILQTRASVVSVTARINPPFYSMEDPIPENLMITLSGIPNPYKPDDIDPDSLLVGGVVEMAPIVGESDEWPKITKNAFKFKVYGDELMYWVVLPYIWHMGYPPHTRVDIDILVEGQFYSGESFQGTCTLSVFTEKPEYDDPLLPP